MTLRFRWHSKYVPPGMLIRYSPLLRWSIRDRGLLISRNWPWYHLMDVINCAWRWYATGRLSGTEAPLWKPFK